jgi:acetylornithine deacetylase/succinyl-diaminopimelate desuccinylase-like protein
MARAPIGLKTVEPTTPGHPCLWRTSPAGWAPAVLVYGHDVQPAVMEDGWLSDPFEPVERDGRIYARGSSDDKGQVFVHLKAAEATLASEGKLPVNIKFLIEGEEEIGSPNVGQFIDQHLERLKADICVISDTGMPSIDQPVIVHALRGNVKMELVVTGPSNDLHSGGYGGSVHNPAQAIAEIIAQLHNPDGSVAVPGFYDDVLPLSPEEREELTKTEISEEALKQMTDVPQTWGEPGFTLRERIGARPTLEITGIASGYYGEGFKTVLPARAIAKISCRLVANQKPHRIYELVRDYIAQITPPTVRSELCLLKGGSAAAHMDIRTPALQAAIAAYEKGWGKRPVFMREGGSIPVVVDFQQKLGLPVVLMGFGLTTDGAHGPNENFTIEMFHKGIDTAIRFLQEVAVGVT